MPEIGARAAESGDTWKHVGVVIEAAAVHLAILAYMWALVRLTTGEEQTGLDVLRNAMSHWDARHYLAIAERGYCDDLLLVFFPLYPFLIHYVALVFPQPLIVALGLNLCFHVGAAYYLYRLVRLDHPDAVARLSVVFFLVYPGSFVCVVPYSESLFLFALLASIYSYRTGRYLASGIFGFAAGLTRVTGCVLVGLLAWEWIGQRRATDWRRALLPLFGPVLAVGLYLMLNRQATGDAFFFMDMQKDGWDREIALPGVGFRSAWEVLGGGWPEKFTMGFNNLAGAFLAWSVAAYAILKERKSYGLFCLFYATLITFQSRWLSIVRFDLVLFPLYVMLARVPGPWMPRLLLIGSTTLLAVLAQLFARGQWAM